jgi:predicted cobalt transporter CbtA
MVRTLLIRGMLAGLLAGLLVFCVGKFLGEPQLDRAIGFEQAQDDARARNDATNHLHAVEEPALVSRNIQAGIGLFTGIMVYATAFGGLFALVFAVVDQRIVGLRPRATSALLATAGFVAVYLVPNLKYPASPPSVGEPETIGLRTALYFIMLALSVGAMVAAAVSRKHLTARMDAWNAALIACGLYLLVVLVAAQFLPIINEAPDGFPAEVLWQFRVVSCGMQLVMWTTIGLAFGAMTERSVVARDRLTGPRRAPATLR